MRDLTCGNLNCSCSSGICEELTFGHGKLSNSGYWQYPCLTCALAFAEEHPDMLAAYGVWPMTEEQAQPAEDTDDEFVWSEMIHDYDEEC